MLNQLVGSETEDILATSSSWYKTAELYFTDYESWLFENVDSDFKTTLQTTNTSFNVHHFGVTFEHWEKYNLGEFYNIVTYSIDDENQKVVSSMEAKHYPIYGV